ncbi:MAG: DUF4105 domain-containing protein [Planctomycetota bacterium]
MEAEALPDSATPSPRPKPRKLLRAALFVLILMVLAGLTIWMGLAVCYADVHAPTPRTGRALLVGLVACCVLILVRPRRIALALFALLFAGVLIWFACLQPSNQRDWSEDVAVLPEAIIEDNRVTLRHIRNFEYRSEQDYSPAYYDATFDLSRLRSIDLVVSFWSSPLIAHTLLSFGFDEDRYVAISIETRKEKTESYSSVQGFFRRYDLIYVTADERDAIGARTNSRGEQVYLYRLRMSRDKMRRVFLDYAWKLNALRNKPEFFNTLTSNCTTAMWEHLRCTPPDPPLSPSMILSGYTPEYAYRIGLIDHSMPFDQLERRSRINDLAVVADHAPDFSKQVRRRLIDPNGM